MQRIKSSTKTNSNLALVASSSQLPTKSESTMFKSTAVLASSVTNMALPDDVKPWPSSSPIREKESISPDTEPRRSLTKKRLSPRSSLLSGPNPLASVPRLLVKRSSLKSAPTTGPAIKPNMSLSITDASTSSSNTAMTDRFSSSNASNTDQEEAERLIKETVSRDKPSIRAKVHRVENSKERSNDALKRKDGDAHPGTQLPPAYESESISEDWTKSQGEMNEILIIDEEESPQLPVGKHPPMKRARNKKTNRIEATPFQSKTRSNHQTRILDSSRCKITWIDSWLSRHAHLSF